jgi:DNA-binding NarL/FixJ family response regulator
MKRISVCIVDDIPTARFGIRQLLQKYPDVHIIAEAENGQAFLDTHYLHYKLLIMSKPYAFCVKKSMRMVT